MTAPALRSRIEQPRLRVVYGPAYFDDLAAQNRARYAHAREIEAEAARRQGEGV